MTFESEQSRFIVFAIAWFAVSLGLFIYNLKCKDAAFKRKMNARILLLVCMIFIGLVNWMARPSLPMMALITLVTFFIGFWNVWRTKFCDACGATVIARYFAKPEICSRCGAKLLGR